MALTYDDFLKNVEKDNLAFVEDIHKLLSGFGCNVTVKEAKQGCLVTYTYSRNQKKISLMNYVFRKSGMYARIYARHIRGYQDILDSLPKEIKKDMAKAGDCKRLNGISECSPSCTAGYDFIMDSTNYRKCKNSAFFWRVEQKSFEPIKGLLENELRLIECD